MRILSLVLVLFFSHSVYASKEMRNSCDKELSWSQVVQGALECLDEDEEINSTPVAIAPTLKITALEYDLQNPNVPVFLHFQANDMAYKLEDSNGGATVAFLYACCMSNVHKEMVGLNLNAAEAIKTWRTLNKHRIPMFGQIKPLLIYSIQKLIAINDGANVEGLQKILSRESNHISYGKMYEFLGTWLRAKYDNLPSYEIEVTDLKTYVTKVIKGIKKCESSKGLNWTPVSNTLNFFCHMRKFESQVTYHRGIYEIDYDNLALLIQAVEQKYHSVKTVEKGPSGEIIITEKRFPENEAPQIAVAKKIQEEKAVPIPKKKKSTNKKKKTINASMKHRK